MKNCAIVPHIVGGGFKFSLGDIADQPANPFRGSAQLLGSCDSRLRNIKNRQVGAVASEQVVHQRGLARTDIDDGGGGSTAPCSITETDASRCRRYQLT